MNLIDDLIFFQRKKNEIYIFLNCAQYANLSFQLNWLDNVNMKLKLTSRTSCSRCLTKYPSSGLQCFRCCVQLAHVLLGCSIGACKENG
jgi:hypothetical protein